MASTALQRRRAGWWIGALTVIVAGVAVTVLFRPIGVSPRARPAPAAPKVEVAKLPGSDQSNDERPADRLLHDQATIMDPTPLFLPTRWNASQQPLPATLRRQPEQVFGDYPPVFINRESTLSLSTSPAQPVPHGPLDLLREASHDPFVGFDRQDAALRPLPERVGFVEVSRVGDGDVVLARKLDRPVVLPAGRLDWQPAEFLVNVIPSGLLGRPAILASSDIEEVDLFLQEYLSETLHIGQRLPPGIYRIVVGP